MATSTDKRQAASMYAVVIYISSMPTMHATIGPSNRMQTLMQRVDVSDEAWFVYTRNDSPAADSS